MDPRLLRVSAALLALLVAPIASEQPRFQPKEGSRVQRTYESMIELSLEEMTLTVDGEDWPEEMAGGLEVAITQKDTYVVVDTYKRMGEGRPLELLRKYETLDSNSSEASRMGGEGETSETEQESELEGREVRFTWDEEAQRFVAAFPEGEGDAELLEDLDEDMDLRGFLPGREVATGDTWDVDLKVFDLAMSPGGDLKLESDNEDDPDFGKQLEEHLEGDVRATAKGTRDVEGRKLFVIALTAEVETWGEAQMEPEEDEEGKSTATLRMELRLQLEGELLWDLEAGRPHSLEFQGPLHNTLKTSSTYADGEASVDVVQVMKFKGTSKAVAKFETPE